MKATLKFIRYGDNDATGADRVETIEATEFVIEAGRLVFRRYGITTHNEVEHLNDWDRVEVTL